MSKRTATEPGQPAGSRWLPLLCLSLAAAVTSLAYGAANPQPWLSTWAASAQESMQGLGPAFDGQTIRQRMRISVGGEQIRVRYSNAFGKTPLVIGHATIGLPGADPASVKSGSLKELSFGGRSSVSIPPGASALSDPVAMKLPAGSLVTTSLYLPGKFASSATIHSLGLRTAIISPKGDFAAQTTVPEATKSASIYFVMELMVPKTKADQFTIVAFGDSITDGNNSTPETDATWPAVFARRLAAAGKADRIAIVNQGIGGNQLRKDFAGVSAQARFDRDVLAIPGVKYVVLLEGINDLGFPGAKMNGRALAPVESMPTADDIIAAYQQLIARAHLHGLKIYGGTLTPFKGTDLPGYYEEWKEPVREQINAWIRTSGAFDAVLDFDAVLRDAEDPHKAAAPLISPTDHLHPSDAGYQKMAESIDLALFK